MTLPISCDTNELACSGVRIPGRLFGWAMSHPSVLVTRIGSIPGTLPGGAVATPCMLATLSISGDNHPGAAIDGGLCWCMRRIERRSKEKL